VSISMCWVAVSVFSLATPSVVISLSNRIFLPAYLPAFHFFHSVRDYVFGYRPIRFFFEILISAWSSETYFGFSECSLGVLHGAARTSVFLVFG
jgi:hypothetical protein